MQKVEKHSIIEEFQIQLKTSIPTTLGLLLYKIPWLISLRFVGNIGSDELAAASLASSLCNVTGMSFAVGLSTAMTTMTGQARGEMLRLRKNGGSVCVASPSGGYGSIPSPNISESVVVDGKNNNVTSPMVYLLRGIFIELLFVLPVGIYWIYGIGPLLKSFGQSEKLSSMTESYLRVLTPGLWSYSINWTLTAWLQSLEMADVPAYAALVGVIVHIPFNLFFLYVLDWGYLGVAAGTVMIIQPFLICIYLWLTPHGRQRIHKECYLPEPQSKSSTLALLSKAVLSCNGVCQYLSLAIPGVLVISEWWASEGAILLSTRLRPYPELALDGMTIYQTINTACFMFPMGASVSGSTRVSNFLGLHDHTSAIRSAYVSVLYAGCWSFTLSLVLFFTPHDFFPSLFTPDRDVSSQAAQVIPYLAFYVFADGLQVAFNSIIKGCGRQCITIPIVIIAYWFIGIPFAYYASFTVNDGVMFNCDATYLCGIKGLVAGLTAGTWTHMILLAVTVVFATDWKLEAYNARQRIGFESGATSDCNGNNHLVNGTSSTYCEPLI